jgi:L-aspartate oxidase
MILMSFSDASPQATPRPDTSQARARAIFARHDSVAGRIGGHSRNRIFHAGGTATGAAIARTLIGRVAADPRIHVVEHAAAIGLVTDGDGCAGAWILGHDELQPVRARITLLATGGAGALYSRTTNPPGATGDGIAIAHRAGADVRDMEFVQFHPTAVATAGRAFLVSEAVRGEARTSSRRAGDRFMLDEHPDAELAPRDVVTRVIQPGPTPARPSYLSLGHLDAARVRAASPTWSRAAPGSVSICAQIRFPGPGALPDGRHRHGSPRRDLARRPLRSGESACTGAHGANRLASNSLLECFVFAHRAVAAGLDAVPHDADRPLARGAAAGARAARRAPRRMWSGARPVRIAGPRAA